MAELSLLQEKTTVSFCSVVVSNKPSKFLGPLSGQYPHMLGSRVKINYQILPPKTHWKKFTTKELVDGFNPIENIRQNGYLLYGLEWKKTHLKPPHRYHTPEIWHRYQQVAIFLKGITISQPSFWVSKNWRFQGSKNWSCEWFIPSSVQLRAHMLSLPQAVRNIKSYVGVRRSLPQTVWLCSVTLDLL